MKFKRWRWPAFISSLVVALSAYWLTQIWLGPEVAGYAVVRQELIQTVDASGKVELPPAVEISSSVHGKVADIKVAPGEPVSAGQILLTVENRVERGAIEKARAARVQAEARFKQISEQTQAGSEHSIRRAKANLEDRKKQYARTRELAAKGFAGQDHASDALRNLTIAQSQLATALFQAKVNRAKGSEYALAEAALNKARDIERAAQDRSGNKAIKAEFAGVLTSSRVARGEMVMPGKTLMVLSPAGKPRVRVQLAAKSSSGLTLGQAASVTVEGHPEQRFSAALAYINPEADATRGTIELKFDAINPPDYLSHDMVVSLAIEVARRADALSVPATAIRNAEGEEPWVMAVENGRAQRRTVKLGVRGKDKVEVLEGLREGDLVLPASGAAVEEGRRLRLARAG